MQEVLPGSSERDYGENPSNRIAGIMGKSGYGSKEMDLKLKARSRSYTGGTSRIRVGDSRGRPTSVKNVRPILVQWRGHPFHSSTIDFSNPVGNETKRSEKNSYYFWSPWSYLASGHQRKDVAANVVDARLWLGRWNSTWRSKWNQVLVWSIICIGPS